MRIHPEKQSFPKMGKYKGFSAKEHVHGTERKVYAAQTALFSHKVLELDSITDLKILEYTLTLWPPFSLNTLWPT